MHGVHRKVMMKYKNYEVVNCYALNIRQGASIESKIIDTVKNGDILQVVTPNAVVEITDIKRIWHKVKYNNQYGYVNASYTKVKDYLSIVANNSKKVYNKIIDVGCIHKSGAKTYSEMITKKIATCGTFVSIVLQLSGLIPNKKIISHTIKNGNESNCINKKNTVSKAILNSDNLINGTCSIIKIGKTYSKMNDKYKKEGITYVYNSSICINAGNDSIYALLNANYQKKNNKYTKIKLKGNYYPFSHKILYAIVPNS